MIVNKYIWIRPFKTEKEMSKFLGSAAVSIEEGECEFYLNAWGWRGTLRASDPRLPSLLKRCKAADNALVIESIEYTDAELSAAELLLLGYKVKVRGDSGPDLGNKYDYSQACPACLTGARLIPPFRFKPSDLPKRKELAISHIDDVFVRGRLLAALMTLPGSDSWLVPMVSRKSGEPLEWASLQPQVILPKLHPATIGVKQDVADHFSSRCKSCFRDSFSPCFEPALQPAYSRKDVNNACQPFGGLAAVDIFASWECFGPGSRPNDPNPRRVAQPFLFFSPRVASLFRQLVPRDSVLIPVRLLDESSAVTNSSLRAPPHWPAPRPPRSLLSSFIRAIRRRS